MLCTAVAFLYASEANGQCAAKDVLQNVAAPRIAAAIAPSIDAVRETWKTITLGRFTNSFALRNALDAAGCGVGDLAEQIDAKGHVRFTPESGHVRWCGTIYSKLSVRQAVRGKLCAPSLFWQPMGLFISPTKRYFGFGDKDDYVVLDGGRVIGRIALHLQAPEGHPWFWTITAREFLPPVYNKGYCVTREEAVAELRDHWTN